MNDFADKQAAFSPWMKYFDKLYDFIAEFGRLYQAREWFDCLAALDNWASMINPYMESDDEYFSSREKAEELVIKHDSSFFFCPIHKEWRVRTIHSFGAPIIKVVAEERAILLFEIRALLNQCRDRLRAVMVDKGLDVPMKKEKEPGKQVRETHYG